VVTLILRRALTAIPTLLGISLIAFVLVKQIPGDPVRIACGKQCDPASQARIRHAMHLDEPMWQQYMLFVHSTFDLNSAQNQQLMSKGRNSAELAVGAIGIEIVLGLGIGIAAAMRHKTRVDSSLNILAILCFAVPTFVVAEFLFVWFTLPWPNWDFSNWFNYSPLPPSSFLAAFEPSYWVHNLFLPSLALALAGVGGTALLMRSSLLEVLRADHLTTSLAQGMTRGNVIRHRAMKLALLPVVTLLGLDFGRLIGGAIVVEIIFNWPGIGSMVIGQINTRDATGVVATATFLAAIYVIITTVVDLLYMFIDPRIRYH
jgi:ABC-type dipeptide/oligopeptide/nickel transport system permease component